VRPLRISSHCIALLAASVASGFAQQVQTDFDKHVASHSLRRTLGKRFRSVTRYGNRGSKTPSTAS
jgi:hypothetical protein